MKTIAQRHVCINALFILQFMDTIKQTNALKIVHPALLGIMIQDYAFSYAFSMNFSMVR
jgi:hypothetical protein